MGSQSALTRKNEDVFDKLETMIIMALESTSKQHTEQILKYNSLKIRLIDQGTLLNFGEMTPSSFYSIDMVDPDRIFSSTPDYLARHPSDVLGEEAEFALISGDIMKWFGYRRLRRPPVGVCLIGRASHWYEAHIRLVTPSGLCEYSKRVIPLDKIGRPLFAKLHGHNVCEPSIDGLSLILCASAIEDAHRSNAMLASVRDAAEIKFPVPIADYREFFSMRDGPMNGNRRKSIIHWVAKHLRRSAKGNEFPVKRHTRGIQEFSVDGINIKITPN